MAHKHTLDINNSGMILVSYRDSLLVMNMSDFAIFNKKVIYAKKHEFEKEIDIYDYQILLRGQYLKRRNDTGGYDFFFGSALYLGERVDKNKFEILSIEDINLNDISGRYLIISISSHSIKILNSMFGSFPCYIDKENGIVASNQSFIAKVKSGNINLNGIRERSIFFTNYNESLFENIKSLKPGSISVLNGSSLISKSYLKDVIRKKSNISSEEAIERIGSILENNTKAYFDKKSAFVSYTGGRDSRLLLCELIRSIPKDKIKAFTVGFNEDIEYFIGRRFTKRYDISHDLIKPLLLNEGLIDKYVKDFENINFPCQYKNQVVDYLTQYDEPDVLNTAIPETILCHMDYFLGGSHYAVNFVRNRKSIFTKDQIISGKSIVDEVELEVVNIWNELREELPSDVSANIFFELTTFQRDWVFKILRPFDVAGNTVCVMEDPKIMSILSSLEINDFLNDRIYKKLVEKIYPELHVTPTTRDINFSILNKYKPMEIIKLSPLIIRSLVYAGSLSKLLKMNHPFIVDYCKDNYKNLDVIFETQALNNLLSKQSHDVYSDNRVMKLYTKALTNKSLINDYELIGPLCMIALLKNNKYE